MVWDVLEERRAGMVCDVLEEREGGGGTQKFVYQKKSDQMFPRGPKFHVVPRWSLWLVGGESGGG